MLSSHCGVHVDAAMLKATELRLAGNAAARAGDLRKAEQLFSEVWRRAPCQHACQQSGLGPARGRQARWCMGTHPSAASDVGVPPPRRGWRCNPPLAGTSY